jgi:transcription initiation factor TFIIIB Brf1 subunit/transcription initiation factor TFIIB
MNCPNCNTKLSCGCQKKVASDGKQVCSNCLTVYENKLKANALKNT